GSIVIGSRRLSHDLPFIAATNAISRRSNAKVSAEFGMGPVETLDGDQTCLSAYRALCRCRRPERPRKTREAVEERRRSSLCWLLWCGLAFGLARCSLA